MSQTTVEIGRVRGFVLDDPEAGVLDNTEFPLGGLDFFDVTSFIRNVSIQRGKNRDLERFSAGTLDVELNNQTRFFDPFVATEIDPIPRVPIRVKYGVDIQYSCVIDDWDYSYSPGGYSFAVAKAADDFTKLARTTVDASGTAVPASSGERVEEVLDMLTVQWPSDKRIIDEGVADLCAGDYEGQNALEYLQLIETSEQGQLFVDKEGNLVFQSRLSATPTSAGLKLFSDDGTGIPYTEVVVNYGTELMVNRAVVSAPLTTATANNERSQSTYGVISQEIEVLCSSSPQVQNIADFIVAKYGEPEYRFEMLSLDLDTMTSGQVDDVMGLEIGDVVEVKFRPNNIGTSIDQYAQVIGINHDINITSHRVGLRLASLDFTFLVLDDTVFGTMDNNYLAF